MKRRFLTLALGACSGSTRRPDGSFWHVDSTDMSDPSATAQSPLCSRDFRLRRAALRGLTGVAVAALLPCIMAPLADAATSSDRARFEAVSIHPSAPADGTPATRISKKGGPGTPDPGTFVCQNFPLSALILDAFGLSYVELSAPAWVNTTRFNIVAKVPAGASGLQFKEMIQDLLTERFGLSAHFDTREMQTYDLVVSKGGSDSRRAKARARGRNRISSQMSRPDSLTDG